MAQRGGEDVSCASTLSEVPASQDLYPLPTCPFCHVFLFGCPTSHLLIPSSPASPWACVAIERLSCGW